MAILSASHKCPVCGRVWMMPVNTRDPGLKDQQKAMKDGAVHLPTVCDGCKKRRSSYS